jgi:hypothetical protein
MSYDVKMTPEKLNQLVCDTRDFAADTTLYQFASRFAGFVTSRPLPVSVLGVTYTVAQARAAADWAESGDDMSAVELTGNPDGTLTAAQGDDHVTFNPDGTLTATPAAA